MPDLGESRSNESNRSPIQTQSKSGSLSFSKSTKCYNIHLSFEGFEKTKVEMVVLLFEKYTGWHKSSSSMRIPELPVTAGQTRQRFYTCKNKGFGLHE